MKAYRQRFRPPGHCCPLQTPRLLARHQPATGRHRDSDFSRELTTIEGGGNHVAFCALREPRTNISPYRRRTVRFRGLTLEARRARKTIVGYRLRSPSGACSNGSPENGRSGGDSDIFVVAGQRSGTERYMITSRLELCKLPADIAVAMTPGRGWVAARADVALERTAWPGGRKSLSIRLQLNASG